MSDFYLTLHSDQNSIKGLNNSASCFKVYLGHEMLLPGKWEVGLAEIYYPYTMEVMTEEEATIVVEYLHPKTGNVLSKTRLLLRTDNQGYVALDTQLFFLLFHDAMRKSDIDVYLTDNVRVQLAAVSLTRRVIFSDKMRRILGFDECSNLIDNICTAPQGINIKRILPQQLLVSTDLIHHQLVGGTYDQILRSVHVDGDKYNFGCMGHAKFEQIQYYDVDHHKIDDIAVYIKDRYGRCVSFTSGTSSVVLHFRKLRHD